MFIVLPIEYETKWDIDTFGTFSNKNQIDMYCYYEQRGIYGTAPQLKVKHHDGEYMHHLIPQSQRLHLRLILWRTSALLIMERNKLFMMKVQLIYIYNRRKCSQTLRLYLLYWCIKMLGIPIKKWIYSHKHEFSVLGDHKV